MRWTAASSAEAEVASARFPHALLHFEDFGPANARRILVHYGDTYRIFNDDMQGTGAITLAAVIAATKVTGIPLQDQKVVVFGAGTAGVGIGHQLSDAMVRAGASQKDATTQVYLVDIDGLITDDMKDMRDFQQPYARTTSEVAGWGSTGAGISLLDTIRNVGPNILVGTSTAHGAFTKEVVEAMGERVDRPIILPLSNPTSRIEAIPSDIVSWSKGKALVATGIPADPVEFEGTTYTIGQANNARIYPGLGWAPSSPGQAR